MATQRLYGKSALLTDLKQYKWLVMAINACVNCTLLWQWINHFQWAGTHRKKVTTRFVCLFGRLAFAWCLFQDMRRFKLPYLCINLGPWPNFQKLHTYSISFSTPQGAKMSLFLLYGQSYTYMSDFQLPYLYYETCMAIGKVPEVGTSLASSSFLHQLGSNWARVIDLQAIWLLR